MKKNYLITAVIFLTCGCNSNDDKIISEDQILSNTEWIYGNFEDDDILDMDPVESIDTVSYDPIEKYFPDIQLICTKGEIEFTEKSDTTIKEISSPRAKLKFSIDECQYYADNGYKFITINNTKYYSQTITYKAQSYTSSVNPYLSLEVTEEAIKFYLLNPNTNNLTEHNYLKLDNFKNTKKWKETNTSKSKEYIDIDKDIFSYKRLNNEIILSNEKKKWIGVMDSSNWTISFTQISPNKIDIPTFTLN